MTKKCHENSGGYALCLLYIVMCAILRVVAYFLSVNLLHMSNWKFFPVGYSVDMYLSPD